MKWDFDTKRFLKTLAGYMVVLVGLDIILTRYFDFTELKQSIIEVFLAIIIIQIIEELYRRYKNK